MILREENREKNRMYVLKINSFQYDIIYARLRLSLCTITSMTTIWKL